MLRDRTRFCAPVDEIRRYPRCAQAVRGGVLRAAINDAVDHDAGASASYHRGLLGGHLGAGWGRWTPLDQPSRQRSCHVERGRPRPRVTQDLHQLQPRDLGGWPGDGGEDGPPPRRGRGGGPGQLEGTPGGIVAVHHRFSSRRAFSGIVGASGSRAWTALVALLATDSGAALPPARRGRAGACEFLSGLGVMPFDVDLNSPQASVIPDALRAAAPPARSPQSTTATASARSARSPAAARHLAGPAPRPAGRGCRRQLVRAVAAPLPVPTPACCQSSRPEGRGIARPGAGS
jgi:hypothetical protein